MKKQKLFSSALLLLLAALYVGCASPNKNKNAETLEKIDKSKKEIQAIMKEPEIQTKLQDKVAPCLKQIILKLQPETTDESAGRQVQETAPQLLATIAQEGIEQHKPEIEQSKRALSKLKQQLTEADNTWLALIDIAEELLDKGLELIGVLGEGAGKSNKVAVAKMIGELLDKFGELPVGELEEFLINLMKLGDHLMRCLS